MPKNIDFWLHPEITFIGNESVGNFFLYEKILTYFHTWTASKAHAIFGDD